MQLTQLQRVSGNFFVIISEKVKSADLGVGGRKMILIISLAVVAYP